jgi:multiple sugar transport system permease protein
VHRTKRSKHIGSYLIVLGYLVVCLFPIVWLLLSSFKPAGELNHYPPVWIPSHFILDYYSAVLKGAGMHALFNSIFIAVVNTLLALILGLPAAYSIGRWQTGGFHLSFWFLSQRMLPPIVLVIPVFMFFRTLHWIDTYQAIIVMYLTFNLPYVVWMMKDFFREIPLEIEESAYVDGAGRVRTFLQIVIPMAKNGIISTAIFCLVFSWTEFLFALVLSRTTVTTLPVYMAGLFGQYVQWGAVSALSIIMSVPVFIVSVTLSQRLARGLTLGAVK